MGERRASRESGWKPKVKGEGAVEIGYTVHTYSIALGDCTVEEKSSGHMFLGVQFLHAMW